eukprot:m.146985 g.146985  ORF g.146985 m.146985 type:complete len:146 (+) comp14979_c1_seq8:1048-1485(+)
MLQAAMKNRPKAIRGVLDEVDWFFENKFQLESYGGVQDTIESVKSECISAYLNNPGHFETGDTPLHVACRYYSVQAIEELVSFGNRIKLNIHNRDGLKPRELIGHESSVLPEYHPVTGIPMDEENKIDLFQVSCTWQFTILFCST